MRLLLFPALDGHTGESATDLWPDEAPTAPTPQGGLHGSAPWFLGCHALLTLDYDLSAEFEPWEPPQPFDENTYVDPAPTGAQRSDSRRHPGRRTQPRSGRLKPRTSPLGS